MNLHELSPAPGSTQRPTARAAATAPATARPPAAARRASGPVPAAASASALRAARCLWPAACPSAASTTSLPSPWRRSTSPPEQVRGRRHRQRLRPAGEGYPLQVRVRRQGPGQRRADQEADRPCLRFLRLRQGEDRSGRRKVRGGLSDQDRPERLEDPGAAQEDPLHDLRPADLPAGLRHSGALYRQEPAEAYLNAMSGTIFGLINAMSGDAFSMATVFALAVQPYINSSIIIQLLTVAIPALERLPEGGRRGGPEEDRGHHPLHHRGHRPAPGLRLLHPDQRQRPADPRPARLLGGHRHHPVLHRRFRLRHVAG